MKKILLLLLIIIVHYAQAQDKKLVIQSVNQTLNGFKKAKLSIGFLKLLGAKSKTHLQRFKARKVVRFHEVNLRKLVDKIKSNEVLNTTIQSIIDTTQFFEVLIYDDIEALVAVAQVYRDEHGHMITISITAASIDGCSSLNHYAIISIDGKTYNVDTDEHYFYMKSLNYWIVETNDSYVIKGKGNIETVSKNDIIKLLEKSLIAKYGSFDTMCDIAYGKVLAN